MRSLSLNNNVKMPALGFGVFQTPPDETRTAAEAALSTGYRHIERGGPDPAVITLEAFGRPIPED
jgi:hypothetical protein